jgi:hypothetical protein
MHAALQRLARLAERRLPALTRLRGPELLPLELARRRIYIVPTGFGLGFGVLLLVMLLGALNYANNAALLLTCLLGAAAAASMLVALSSSSPPYSSGQSIINSPNSPHLAIRSFTRPKSWFSISSWRGMTSFRTNRSVVAPIWRCSSVKSSGVKTSSPVTSVIRYSPPLKSRAAMGFTSFVI